ncbi:N-acetylmuramoyl-L-alanine amidase [bacterium]|nr:N-acetylmuramoyl-L-alanine amidase [bacterium]
MKKWVLLLILFVSVVMHAYAFELIRPTEKKSIVNTNYAFFYGKAKGYESISINDERVYIAPNGAFAHSVKLKDGENRIMVRSTYGMQIYNIYKNTIKNQEIPTEDFSPRKAYVKCDNTPLRSTPVDAGLNRMSHLYQGTSLLINGSKGSFYRVFLSKNKQGWIAKDAVVVVNSDSEGMGEFLGMNSERFKNAIIQTISFTKRLPYTIEDTDKEILFRVYNPELSEDSVYNINIPKPDKYIYSVKMDEGEYTFKVKKLTENINECTIVVDAGHGGAEKGAIGCLGDEEKDINLNIAIQLAQMLKAEGFNVIMTRDYDSNLSLNDRVQIAKDNEADIFVSIHLNSIPDIPMDIHKNRGTSVYYFNKNSKDLAESLVKNVTKTLGTRDDGVRTASFAVIRPTNYIGVLVETAYMTNPLDSVIYGSKDFAQKAAKGICKGILEYFNSEG